MIRDKEIVRPSDWKTTQILDTAGHKLHGKTFTLLWKYYKWHRINHSETSRSEIKHPGMVLGKQPSHPLTNYSRAVNNHFETTVLYK